MINDKFIKEINKKYRAEDIIRGYDNFIQLYKKHHFNELMTTLNKEDWYKKRDDVMERFIIRYYMRN